MEKSLIHRVDSADPSAGQYIDGLVPKRPADPPASRNRNSSADIQHIYASLPLLDALSFRLCHISPGVEDDPVVVTLTGDTLDDPTRDFAALSYAWGEFDGDRPYFITVNGVPFEVTRNLLTQLRRLRTEGVRMIWSDALCISQASVSEKAQQVCLMGLVFSQATTVFIGLDELGIDRRESPLAHAMVKDTLEKLARSTTCLGDFQCLLGPGGNETREASHLLLRLLRSQWFTRTWVVQEVCLARSPVILCNWGTLPWQTLSDALKCWSFHHQTGCCLFQQMAVELEEALFRASNHVFSINMMRESPEARHILDAILFFQPLSATDHRDKINGFRELHTVETEIPLPPPGYADSELCCFERFTAWVIQVQKSLLPCALELQHETNTSKCPSWVIDLSATLHVNPIYWRARLKFYRLFNCGAELPWRFEHVPNSGRLVLKGALIDTVGTVCDEYFDFPKVAQPGDDHEHFEYLKRMSAFAAGRDDHAITEDWPGLDEFAVTILGGCVWTEDGTVRPANEDDVEEWKERLVHFAKHSADVREFQNDNLINSHFTAILRRRFLRTTASRLGTAPLSTRPSDQIFVLSGGNLPFVLRPLSNNPPHESEYQMIGMCYLPAYVESDSRVLAGTQRCILV